MKKKLLSFALCLTMVATSFTVFPIATNAAELDSAINENTITETQDVNITGDENVENTNDNANIVNDNEQLNGPVDADDNSSTEEQQTDVEKKDTTVEPDKNDATEHQKINKDVTDKDNEQESNDVHEDLEAVNFTDAGPFMDPVFVGSLGARMMMAMPFSLTPEPDADGNGLALSKQSVKQSDGSYKITMDAYTTGKVTSNEKSIPVDVTLVLDQSGSMDYNFAGSGSSGERQQAMKVAVNNFINSVGEKYDENTADHRISLVEFRSKANILKTWTAADAKGVSSLKSTVSSLNADGATNVGDGMEKAETLMGKDYNYKGANTERQKVVIVFTDGVPTTSSEFHTGVANTAIKAARNLKASGCTVYSVGIFNGADPAQTYGDKGFKHNSDGSVNSMWYDEDNWFSGGLGAIDIPAGNRFLNYMSSNFKDASEIGIKSYEKSEGWFTTNVGWKITKNFNRTDTGYYLSANNAADLNKIFQTIVENIQTANIDLDGKTVLKDMVTPYFNMPAKTSDIKVYTADYNGSSFGNRVPATGVNVTKSGNTVSVTGFDYNKNFVTENVKEDGTFGKKLIVEFSVTAKDEFLGGNRVPTNESTSGIYDKSGSIVEEFKVPRVDVPLKSYKAVASDINIYLNGEVTRADIEGNSGTKFFNNREFGELLSWQKAYVDFDQSATGMVNNAKGDSTYEITGQLKPKFAGDVKDGPVVKATGKINVFKPEVTFKDVNGTYGDTFPELSKSLVSTVWKHGDTLSTDVRMTKKKPELNFEYSYDKNLKSGNYINTPNDIPVNVVTKINDENVSEYTEYQHKACDPVCDYIPSEDGEFLVHVKTCTLDVSKNVTGGINDGQKYVMNIAGNTNLGNMKLEVTVDANGKTVVKGLPVGTYNVKENGKWAWRYDVTYNPSTATLSQDNQVGSLVVNNNKSKGKWLNAFSAAENMFGELGGTVERLLDK